jgi:glycosyltransferase involved in cell wall biosynthesis
MKICMIASTYPRFDSDGAGRFNRSLAEALSTLGHDVQVVIPYHPTIEPYETPVRIHPFRYSGLERWSVMGYANAMDSDRRLKWQAYLLILPFLIKGASALLQLVRQHDFDVIHSHWVLPNGPIGLLGKARARSPLFVSLHGSDIYFARKNPLFSAVARQVFRHAQGVTACSPELYESAIELGASPTSTRLILWGADPEAFDSHPDTSDLREQLGLKEDTNVVLGLGRLVGKKGFDILVRAMPDVLASCPRTCCVIAGDGPEGPHLHALADQLGVAKHIRFPGSIPWNQVPEYLHLSELFVAPSVHDEGNLDGLPTVILEAMAAGKPVVASNVAGMPLAVIHNETGTLVPERDEDALAKAICHLLKNTRLRDRLGEGGRDRVRDELNWHQVAQQFVAMYKTALS